MLNDFLTGQYSTDRRAIVHETRITLAGLALLHMRGL